MHEMKRGLTWNISNRASLGISTRSNACFSLTAPLKVVSKAGQSVGKIGLLHTNKKGFDCQKRSSTFTSQKREKRTDRSRPSCRRRNHHRWEVRDPSSSLANASHTSHPTREHLSARRPPWPLQWARRNPRVGGCSPSPTAG